MPNRILKESICTSENIDQLSAFNETVFYRLIVNVDDYGRIDARPRLLASKLFPLKDVRVAQIEDALRALTSAELVSTYTVDGKPFLQMKTWDRHQSIRAKKSKCPAPEEADNLNTSASNCMQMQANVPVIQSNPNPNPNPNNTPLPPKKGKGVFVAPTFEEVETYCKERNNNVDPKTFYDYFTAGNWHDSKGNPVRNWKQKLITWEKGGYGNNGFKSVPDKAPAHDGKPEVDYSYLYSN